MKGIIIYEDFITEFKSVVNCGRLSPACYTCRGSADDIPQASVSGGLLETTTAICSGGDKYDFETGALIALMKMCGRDKVIKACDELYRDDNYKNALQEMTENNEKLIEENKRLKEVLNQMYGIHKESKEKIELPRTLDINGVVYRKSIQIKDADEEIKPLHNDSLDSLIEENRAFIQRVFDEWGWIDGPTKRKEMWSELFAIHKESDVVIKVKREDVNAFLHEIEKKIPEITWASNQKIFEVKHTIGNIYGELRTCDVVHFRLSKATKLSYSSDPDIYLYKYLKHITYLPPMRWDLFKKGRIVVGVRKEQYKEFKEAITKRFGVINIHNPYDGFDYSFFIYDKYANFVESIDRSQFRQLKILNNHKVVYYEDVR